MVSDGGGRAVAHPVLLEVQGIDKKVWTTERGEYWRLLTPGSYRVRAVDPKNSRRSVDCMAAYVGNPYAMPNQ